MNKVLEVGRHYNTYCILTNHLPTNGLYTKRILNESRYVIYFPHSGASRQMRYLLNEYLGLERNTILQIKKCKSRWALVH